MPAIIILVLLVTSQTAQDPASSAEKPAEKQECQIPGQVVQQHGGQPLRKTFVALRPEQPSKDHKQISQKTADDGRFCFKNIAPGRYLLGAEHKGYVKQMYGAEDAWSAGSVMAVEQGQKFEPILLRLMRAGVISGKVVDEDGEAASGVVVQALLSADEIERVGMFQEESMRAIGRKMGLVAVQATVTNDLGEFRLADLAPGKYFVNVMDSGNRINALSLMGEEFTLREDDDASDEYA